MSLSDIFVQQSIKLDLEGTTKETIFTELIELVREAHPEYDHEELFAAVNDRETKMSTGIGAGIAVPHGYCRSVDTAAGAIGISKAGIEYGSLDHKPVHVLFLLVMSGASQENHLRILNQVFKLANSEAIALMLAAKNAEEVIAILSRF